MRGKVVSRIAICHDCGERWEDEKDNQKARYHAYKRGHLVTVNVVISHRYDGTFKTVVQNDR